ncbi:MAG TPA: PDZ domain-containing protein [Nitriliruptorales bacterium]
MSHRVAWLASVVVVLWAIAAVPMPFVTWSPGEAVDLRGAVTVEGQGETLTGPLSLLTIRTKEAGLIDVVRAWLDGDRDLIDRDLAFGAGRDAEEYFAQELQTFSTQLDVSAVAALRALGRDIGAAQQVVEISPDTPADGVLEVGDVLRSVDDVGVESLTELRTRLEQHEPGDVVTIALDREGEPTEVRVTLAVLPTTETVGLGVRMRTLVDEIPIDVVATATLDRIGGPSAGLALALTIFDLLSPDDVVAARRIAVTGTMDVDGNVGNIGGIRQKVIAAEDADAELLIVPVDQLEDARRQATSIEIVGVRTLAEALAALASR